MWSVVDISHLPTFENQKSGHCHYCTFKPISCRRPNVLATPVRISFNKSITILQNHSYVWFESIKTVSSQFAGKRPKKILIYVLYVIFKTGIYTS